MTPSASVGASGPQQAAGANTLQQPELPKSSGLAHLLESNDVPHDSEIPAIRQIIAENQSNLQIDVLRNTEELIRERDEREECVRKHTAVLSPIRRVPPEVMGQIFALTLPWHTKRVGDETMLSPPWRLGHISRTWRHWALADPFLWTTIIISGHYPDLLDIYPLSMMETQLLRSGNVPLAVTFDSWDCEKVDERLLWDLLLPHCERWHTVRLRYRGAFSAFSELLDVVWGRVPQLQKLELVVHDTYNPLGLPNLFSIAPSLREVVLTDAKHTFTSLPLYIPWGQITRYRGRDHPERQFEILVAAPNLVECGLSFVGDERPFPGDKVVTRSHLRRLYLDTGNGSLLNHLTAPALEVLYAPEVSEPLIRFVTRSACRLTRLVLTMASSADALVRALELLPCLEDLLMIADMGVTTIIGFFNRMTISGTPSDLCPRLTSLTYGDRYYTHLFGDHYAVAIIAMAQSRLQSSSLSSLRFLSQLAGARHSAFAQKTQILVDQGLDVTFLSEDQWRILRAKDRP
ncbi:hypothetical protein C8R44DRAFT_774763 [Mycena epipterygia]|nr:hypothetical protein C8R44DRAFT_774763 [Mycena epipterygia]